MFCVFLCRVNTNKWAEMSVTFFGGEFQLRSAPGVIKRWNPVVMRVVEKFQRKVSVQVFPASRFLPFARPPFSNISRR